MLSALNHDDDCHNNFWLDARLQANKNARAPTRPRKKARDANANEAEVSSCVCVSSEAFSRFGSGFAALLHTPIQPCPSSMPAACTHTHAMVEARTHTTSHIFHGEDIQESVHTARPLGVRFTVIPFHVFIVITVFERALFFSSVVVPVVSQSTTANVPAHASLEYTDTIELIRTKEAFMLGTVAHKTLKRTYNKLTNDERAVDEFAAYLIQCVQTIVLGSRLRHGFVPMPLSTPTENPLCIQIWTNKPLSARPFNGMAEQNISKFSQLTTRATKSLSTHPPIINRF